MRSLFTLVALLSGLGLAHAQQVDGYQGDGSGVYPHAKPPTQFDGKKPAWMTILPSWSHSSPITVDDKIFVTVETDLTCDWPQLACLDMKTGKILWQAVLNAAESAAAAGLGDRKAIEADWKSYRDFTKAKYRAWHDKFEGVDKATIMERYKDYIDAEGLERLATKEDGPKRNLTDLLRETGLRKDEWFENRIVNGVHAIGHAYPTPVTDGKHIYVTTADGLFASYDLEGKRLWLQHDPRPIRAGASEPNARSPLLYKNLLLSDVGNGVRAIDRHTGKILWKGESWNTSIATADIITTEGNDVLLTAGGAFLLPDGKRLKVEGWKSWGMQILTKHDEPDVAYFCGAGEHCNWEAKGAPSPNPPPACVRFKVDGDKLVASVLWSGLPKEDKKQRYGGNRPWMVYNDGKLWAPRDGAFDGSTGKFILGTLRNKKWSVACPDTKHYLKIANGHIYGLKNTGPMPSEVEGNPKKRRKKSGTGAQMEIFTLAGKKVSSNYIPMEVPTEEERALIRASTPHRNSDDKVNGYPSWSQFAYGTPFTFGKDCIIIRSMGRIYCFR